MDLKPVHCMRNSIDKVFKLIFYTIKIYNMQWISAHLEHSVGQKKLGLYLGELNNKQYTKAYDVLVA